MSILFIVIGFICLFISITMYMIRERVAKKAETSTEKVELVAYINMALAILFILISRSV